MVTSQQIRNKFFCQSLSNYFQNYKSLFIFMFMKKCYIIIDIYQLYRKHLINIILL